MKPAAASSSSRTDDADGVSSGNVSGGEPIPELPLHLTEKILCCISPIESARLATVCKSWATTVSDRLAARLVPHLFVSLEPKDKPDHFGCGVIVPVPLDGVARQPPSAIPARLRREDTAHLHCIGVTSSGDVAFSHYWSQGKVAVFNPVTGASRSVVGLGAAHHVMPASGGGDAFVSSTDNKLKLSWKAGGRASSRWTHRTVTVPRWQMTIYIVAAVHCNGRFYMLHKNGKEVSVVDVTMPPPLFMRTVPVPGLMEERCFPYFREEQCHLLECDGEVLFVKPSVEFKYKKLSLSCEHITDDLVVVGFEVFRVDEECRLVGVERLPGDQALFVSEESSFAVRASETAGCRSNCIYFVQKTKCCGKCPIESWHVWGAYSMEEEKVLFERPFIEARGCEMATWFRPNAVFKNLKRGSKRRRCAS